MALPQPKADLPLLHSGTQRPAMQPHSTASLGDIVRRADLLDDLAHIERIMLARTISRSPILSAAGAYTVAAGGKRLRAALVLLAARLGHFDLDRAARPAVAVELLHAASLVHDDLVDRAGQRRGRMTVHTQWDQDVALMLGDFLFAAAAHELAEEPDTRVIRTYVNAARTMVEGELRPVTQLRPLEKALDQYYRKIGSKTAVLFEAACSSGMTISGGSDEQIAALEQFGYDLGLAFQIIDDVLDFVGDERTLGKPAGNDLREGTLTLPLIYAVHQSDLPILRDVARTARPDPVLVPQLIAAVTAAGGVARTLDDAHFLVDRAVSHLAIFPPSPARHALTALCTFVINRQQ